MSLPDRLTSTNFKPVRRSRSGGSGLLRRNERPVKNLGDGIVAIPQLADKDRNLLGSTAITRSATFATVIGASQYVSADISTTLIYVSSGLQRELTWVRRCRHACVRSSSSDPNCDVDSVSTASVTASRGLSSKTIASRFPWHSAMARLPARIRISPERCRGSTPHKALQQISQADNVIHRNQSALNVDNSRHLTYRLDRDFGEIRVPDSARQDDHTIVHAHRDA